MKQTQAGLQPHVPKPIAPQQTNALQIGFKIEFSDGSTVKDYKVSCIFSFCIISCVANDKPYYGTIEIENFYLPSTKLT